MIRPTISLTLFFAVTLVACDSAFGVYSQNIDRKTQESNCLLNQEIATLELQLDNNSHETGWSLICDGVTIWNVPIGSLVNQPPGTWMHEHSCLDSNVNVCNFTIADRGQDGFTGEYGFFSLIYGATTVAASRYGETAPFGEQTYCFGTGCNKPPIENDEDETSLEWVSTVVTKPSPNNTEGDTSEENDGEKNETGDWVATVTIKENDEDGNGDYTGANSTEADTNDNNIGKDGNVAIEQDIRNSKSNNSPSTIVIIVCILGAIAMVTVLWVLYKRSHRKDKAPTQSAINYDKEENMKENTKEDQNKVQQSETFVTKESCDNTFVDAV
jgi:hypothetical protein